VLVAVVVGMGVREGTSAMDVSSGVGDGVRVGAMVGVACGNSIPLQALMNKAQKIINIRRPILNTPYFVWIQYNLLRNVFEIRLPYA
jgi:hypothetical protein